MGPREPPSAQGDIGVRDLKTNGNPLGKPGFMTYDKWEPDRPSQEVLAIMQSATLPRSCLRLAGELPGAAGALDGL